MEQQWNHAVPAPAATTIHASEMSLTAPMVRTLRQNVLHARMVYGASAAVCAGLALAQGVIQPAGMLVRLVVGGAVWLCCTLCLLCLARLATRELRSDLRDGTYCVAVGRFLVVRERHEGIESFSHAHYLALAGQRVRISRRLVKLVERESFGSVVYAKRSELIFEVRSAAGQVIYRDPMYRPAAI